MFSESFDLSSSALTAESRLKDIRSKLTEISKAINNFESDLIGLLFMPELAMPQVVETKSGEKKVKIIVNPVEIINNLSFARSMKKELGNEEYYLSEILKESKKEELLNDRFLPLALAEEKS